MTDVESLYDEIDTLLVFMVETMETLTKFRSDVSPLFIETCYQFIAEINDYLEAFDAR